MITQVEHKYTIHLLTDLIGNYGISKKMMQYCVQITFQIFKS